MAYIEWTDEFVVDNELINLQHKTLIGIVNSLHDAVTHGEDSDIVDSSLSGLIDYTHFHFKAEEDLLTGSAELDLQKKEHDRMARQVMALNEKYHQGSATMIFEILDLLHDWLSNHVKRLDKRSFSS